jgi:hypothetical protein
MINLPKDQYEQGVIDVSPIISVVAGGAGTAIQCYPLVVDQSAIITKIHIFNNNGAATNVTFGVGLLGAFVAAGPAYQALAGMDIEITEDQILKIEYNATITVMASVAAAAPANVQVQIEVKLKPGING